MDDHLGKVARPKTDAAAWKVVTQNTQTRKYAWFVYQGKLRVTRYRIAAGLIVERRTDSLMPEWCPARICVGVAETVLHPLAGMSAGSSPATNP